jgi:hypothetical protein
MLIEECGDLSERLLSLGNPIIKLILSMRLPLIDRKLCIDASRSELPMHPHRIAQQQVACSGSQDCWRETVHISVNRREQRVLEIVAVCVDNYSVANSCV